MERQGEKLRYARERLGLTGHRDVVEASQKIAERRSSEEFAVALSRLNIEDKGTVPASIDCIRSAPFIVNVRGKSSLSARIITWSAQVKSSGMPANVWD